MTNNTLPFQRLVVRSGFASLGIFFIGWAIYPIDALTTPFLAMAGAIIIFLQADRNVYAKRMQSLSRIVAKSDLEVRRTSHTEYEVIEDE